MKEGMRQFFLDVVFEQTHVSALINTGASDCFMAANLPELCIQDAWMIEKGEICLADNLCWTILEQVRNKFKLAESVVYYQFNVVNSLCHDLVIGRKFLTVLRSEVSLPGSGIDKGVLWEPYILLPTCAHSTGQ